MEIAPGDSSRSGREKRAPPSLPSKVQARVSIEAGIAMPWHKYTGSFGRSISIEHYGASAPAGELFEKFGFTTAAVVKAAQESLAAANK